MRQPMLGRTLFDPTYEVPKIAWSNVYKSSAFPPIPP